MNVRESDCALHETFQLKIQIHSYFLIYPMSEYGSSQLVEVD